MGTEQLVRQKWRLLKATLDERACRLWAGAEADAIEAWLKQVGQQRYPKARELFITADAGGSNGYRSHVWKHQLQLLADKLELTIHVSHFLPGASKWNKVEHRLFSYALGRGRLVDRSTSAFAGP